MTQDWERRLADLKAEREKRGLTQTELADLAGVSEATVQNLEGGRTYTRKPRTLDGVHAALQAYDEEAAQVDPTEEAPEPHITLRPRTVPLRVQHELTDGEVVDTDVIDLSRGGMKMVVVVTRDPSVAGAGEDEMRADLQEWTRVQRALRNIADGDDNAAAG